MAKQKIIWCLTLVMLALMLQACSNVLFYPTRQLILTPDKVNLKYSDLTLASADGVMLHGWFLPASGEARGNVLFLHGNGENISSHLATVYWLPAQGYNVYLFDYRGYGQSQGSVDLDGSMADIAAMIAYVAAHPSTAGGMIVFGHSLGASMGLYAVAQSPHKSDIVAMISIGAFSDYGAVVRDMLSRSWLTWPVQWPLSLAINNRYSPKRYIADIAPVPMLVMHSDADEIIEPYHAQVLFEAAAEPKYFQLLHSDHNHVFNSEVNRQLLLQWLARFQPVH